MCGFIPDHHRDTLSIPQSRSKPKSTCWGAVCVGADRSLSSLSPTPTATSQEKSQNKLRTALECIPSTALTITKYPSGKKLEYRRFQVWIWCRIDFFLCTMQHRYLENSTGFFQLKVQVVCCRGGWSLSEAYLVAVWTTRGDCIDAARKLPSLLRDALHAIPSF